MIRKLDAFLCVLCCAANLSAAFAQTPAPAKGDILPEAAAGQCVRVTPTGTDIILENTCNYRIAVAVCVPRNAPKSVLCKTEGEDISAMILKISNRGNIGTDFPNGASIYQMACRQPAIPILVNATGGKCVQP